MSLFTLVEMQICDSTAQGGFFRHRSDRGYDDVKIGVKSTAILFGEHERQIIGGLQVLMVAILGVIGKQLGLSLPYYLGLGFAAGLFGYQQTLIVHRVKADCFKAFLNNHWVGATVFVGLALNYWV